MIDFKTINEELLSSMEYKRKEQMPNMIVERTSRNPIINELRFNYHFIYLGNFLIQGQDGTKFELHIRSKQLNGEQSDNNITLAYIQVLEESRRSGLGHKYLGLLTELADKYNYTIDLEVNSKFGIKKSVLKSFYKMHGFEQDKVNKDRMYRLPQNQE